MSENNELIFNVHNPMQHLNEIVRYDINNFIKKEKDMIKNIDKDTFFEILDLKFHYNYNDLIRIIDAGNFTVNEQQNLNIVFRTIKDEYDIGILDIILYLEESILLTMIINFIDEETEWVLKEELSEKFKISSNKKNNIFNILT